MKPTGVGVQSRSGGASPGYDTFVADPIPTNVAGSLPNGESHMFSPLASTLIYGQNDAVLVDPPLTNDQAKAVGDWVEASGKRLTHIFVTHGHGDHWFTANGLAERFGAQVVASAGTIQQMRNNVSVRDFFWDKLWPGQIPAAPVTAVTVPDNRFILEGHDLVIVEVGHGDSDDNAVLHVPDLGLVVAGDAITTVCTSTSVSRPTAAAVPGAGPSTSSSPCSHGGWSPAIRTKIATTTPPASSPKRASTSTTPMTSWRNTTHPKSSFSPCSSGGLTGTWAQQPCGRAPMRSTPRVVATAATCSRTPSTGGSRRESLD